MKRRAGNEIDSLELLLDTICDTFGGVLFVAVLVAVLVGQLGRSASDDSPNNRADIAAPNTVSVDDLQTEFAVLQRALEETRSTFAALRSNASTDDIKSVIDLRNEVTNLMTQRTEQVIQVATVHDELAEFEKRERDRTSRLVAAKDEEIRLKRQLQAEIALRTRTLVLPKLRQTSKEEFPLVVRFARLYTPFVAASNLRERNSKLEDFVILDASGDVIRVTPKPYAGLPITATDEFEASLRQMLGALDPSAVYLSIGIWEDSFAEFQYLRGALVRMKFEYRLVPVRSGEFIQEAPVKDTLVQ